MACAWAAVASLRLPRVPVSATAFAAGGSPQLPAWYAAHRTHAHTRLAINSFCRQQQAGNASSSSCQWSSPVPGRSPGSNLGHVEAVSLAECQGACCKRYGCQAVIFSSKHRWVVCLVGMCGARER